MFMCPVSGWQSWQCHTREHSHCPARIIGRCSRCNLHKLCDTRHVGHVWHCLELRVQYLKNTLAIMIRCSSCQIRMFVCNDSFLSLNRSMKECAKVLHSSFWILSNIVEHHLHVCCLRHSDRRCQASVRVKMDEKVDLTFRKFLQWPVTRNSQYNARAADQASAATRRRHAAPPCLYPQVAAQTAACYSQRRRGTAWAGIRADAIRKLCCQQIGFI